MKRIFKSTILSVDANGSDKNTIQKTHNKCLLIISIDKEDGTTEVGSVMVSKDQAVCLSVGSIINVAKSTSGYIIS